MFEIILGILTNFFCFLILVEVEKCFPEQLSIPLNPFWRSRRRPGGKEAHRWGLAAVVVEVGAAVLILALRVIWRVPSPRSFSLRIFTAAWTCGIINALLIWVKKLPDMGNLNINIFVLLWTHLSESEIDAHKQIADKCITLMLCLFFFISLGRS